MQAYFSMICVRAPAQQILHPALYSGTLWPFVGHLAVLTEYKNVSKRTHQYAQNQEDIMKEATIFPSPQKKHFAPPTLLERCDLSQLILETLLKKNVSVIK